MVSTVAFHRRGPGSIPGLQRHMWVEFVGTLLCSEKVFSRHSGFPLSPKPFDVLEFSVVWFDLHSRQITYNLFFTYGRQLANFVALINGSEL